MQEETFLIVIVLEVLVMSLQRHILMRFTMEICEGGLVLWWTLSAAPTPPPLLSVPPTSLSHEAYSLLAPCAVPPGWCCSRVLLVLVRVRLAPCRGHQGQVLLLARACAQHLEQSSWCQALKVFQEHHGKSQVPRAGVHNNWPAEEVKGRNTFFCWLLVRILDSELVTRNNI